MHAGSLTDNDSLMHSRFHGTSDYLEIEVISFVALTKLMNTKAIKLF